MVSIYIAGWKSRRIVRFLIFIVATPETDDNDFLNYDKLSMDIVLQYFFFNAIYMIKKIGLAFLWLSSPIITLI